MQPHLIHSDWCNKVRYRKNGFLEQVCVCGTDAAMPCGHGARLARANSASYVGYRYALLTDRLDCAASAKINLRCI